ncbi:hypothetical protein ACQKMN_02255 [Ureibacillus composti]
MLPISKNSTVAYGEYNFTIESKHGHSGRVVPYTITRQGQPEEVVKTGKATLKRDTWRNGQGDGKTYYSTIDNTVDFKNKPRSWYQITFTYKAGGVDYAAVDIIEFDEKSNRRRT